VRALEPIQSGTLRLHDFTIFYEAFGDPQRPTVLLLPCWQIVHSRIWKMQVPYLARLFHVITYDAPGNGGAERTMDPRAFEHDRITDQGVGLLDHLGVAQAKLVGFSRGCIYGLWMAARYPERVSGLVLIGNVVAPDWAPLPDPGFRARRTSYQGWEKRNANYWRENYRDWLAFFFGQVFPEAHSTRLTDECIAWGLETTPEILAQTVENRALLPRMAAHEVLARVDCPVLIVHGDDDRIQPLANSRRLAAARPDWQLLVLEGCGHAPHARDAAKVNLEIATFFGVLKPTHREWRRAMATPTRRALFISSPIGLGHVQRDLAIARELRRLVPDLQIDWLAQYPVTQVLEANGETIHPLSQFLASESAHWEQYAGEHELHCFYAWREMDEILMANFMVFLDAVRETRYDVWIGDEAWEVDYYLHENPELKSAPFVFLTDFLGWLPIDRTHGSREALLCADYNADMIEQVARYPRVRDRAIYIGDYDDLVPECFGPNLPWIPEWAREHFQAVGYIAPFDPADYADTPALRARLGYAPTRPLIIAAVGGTRVGRHLLRKTINAWPLIQRERPDAQLVVVAGPRIDPATLPRYAGLEIRPYVHNLYEHLACADLGIVQGGLSTTMELAINRRPFLFFPLQNHCEQVYDVTHRLARYRAGRRMEYAATSLESLATAANETLGSDTGSYRKHETGAVARAAAIVAELL
jgi:pimeloyl-ACP methyl ester carboxylesterase/predicted glycosyltransferase